MSAVPRLRGHNLHHAANEQRRLGRSAWDAAGRRTSLTYPGSTSTSPFVIGYDYLTTGEMTHIRENGATSGAGVLATFAYDNMGRRSTLTRGNGTGTSYGYDDVSRLDLLDHNLAGSANDHWMSFGYNPAGEIVENVRANTAYSHAAANGSVPSTYDGLNRLVTHDGVTILYDARGNIKNDGTNNYVYSSENLLAGMNGTDILHYDPMLRLVKSGFTRFAYDGLEMIAEYNNVGVLQRRHVFGPGVDEPLVTHEGSGTANKRWLHADERGSIVAASDLNGATLSVNSYGDYGEPASTNTGRFQYTGQAWLPELGMHYYKSRIYNQNLPRFMQPDPIGYFDGPNRYAYVKGNPVNRRDPLGLYQVCWTVSTPSIPGYSIGGIDPETGEEFVEVGTSQPGETRTECTYIPDNFGQPDSGPRGYPGEGYYGTPRVWYAAGKPKKGQKKQDMCGSAEQSWPPESVAGIDLTGACAAHDQCYGTLGASKKACDLGLQRNIFRSCLYQGGVYLLCSATAHVYYMAVSHRGHDAHRDAQNSARDAWWSRMLDSMGA